MKISYDYEDLINELEGDITEGLIRPSDILKIVRTEQPTIDNYKPIIDYYYSDHEVKEQYELMTATAALEEMKLNNKIL